MNSDLRYVRSQAVGVRHVGDGVAIPSPSPEALRVRRYLLLSGCQDLVYPYWRRRIDYDTGEVTQRSEFRVSVCGRTPVGEDVRVYRNGAGVGYAGVMRCGNVWACPLCAAKVMRRRGDQIGDLFRHVHDRGGSAVMVTYTAAHTVGHALADLLGGIKTAQAQMGRTSGYRATIRARLGAVVSTEIMYSPRNGWHPHQHQAWFFPAPVSDDQAEALAARLYPMWERACRNVGLHVEEFYRGRRIGVDVRRAWDASEYLSKFDRERDWSLSAEMTAGRLKLGGGGSMTPWAILEQAIIAGKDSPAAELWIEYLRATKGKACISLKGAKALCEEIGMPINIDDYADANQKGEESITIGTLSAGSFDRVVRQGGLGRLLEAARKGGLSALDAELQIISKEV